LMSVRTGYTMNNATIFKKMSRWCDIRLPSRIERI
jgi:hypothetical protein